MSNYKSLDFRLLIFTGAFFKRFIDFKILILENEFIKCEWLFFSNHKLHEHKFKIITDKYEQQNQKARFEIKDNHKSKFVKIMPQDKKIS